MNTHEVSNARARLKPLVVSLGLALGLGGELGVVSSGAAASELLATRRPFPQTANALRDRRAAQNTPLAARAAALLARRAPARLDGGVSVPVTNCDDEGEGSLRNAVENVAVSGDTVNMTGLSCSTITLTSGTILISADDLTIVGPGTDMNGVTIVAGHSSQIFVHVGSGTLALEYLTVASGGKYSTDSDASGGCVFSYGSVSLQNAGVKYCVAESGPGEAGGGGVYAKIGVAVVSSVVAGNTVRADLFTSAGGGIETPGSLFINYSWLHGNEAAGTNSGGNYGLGGALWNRRDTTIRNSTISGNTAGAIAGADLLGEGASSSLEITNTTICDNYSYTSRFGTGLYVGSPIIISNSTITGNVARSVDHFMNGAGIYLSSNAVTTLQSTIVSGNSSYDGTRLRPDDIESSPFGPALFGGSNNLVGYSTVPLPLDTILTSEPRLGALTTGNGGPTPTRAPLPDSPAVNHGNNVGDSQYDQRGPGFPRVVGSFADIGAVESDAIFANGFE